MGYPPHDMCGRFTQRLSSSEFARIFEARDVAERPGGAYNVAPTQQVAAVVVRGDERVVDRFRWGLVPGWADSASIGSRMFNARAETVATSPAFRHSFRAKRCLIPADGFYEWLRLPDGRRQPYYITTPDGSPLAFAGLWSAWRPPASGAALRARPPEGIAASPAATGGARPGDAGGLGLRGSGGPVLDGAGTPEDASEALLSCTIVTTTPNELMSRLHTRMPVILPAAAWAVWLDPALADLGELQGLLRPSDADLVAYPVAPLVNSVRNQGPALIEPVEPAS